MPPNFMETFLAVWRGVFYANSTSVAKARILSRRLVGSLDPRGRGEFVYNPRPKRIIG
jgi:hypothetical protein